MRRHAQPNPDHQVDYRTLAEQMPAITYVVELGDPPRTIYISPQVEPMLGFTPDEWTADPDLWKRLILDEDLPPVLEAIADGNRTGEPFDVEYRSRTRTGGIRRFRNLATFQKDDRGRPRRTHGVIIDITGEKETEAKLRASGDLTRQLFHQTPIGLFFYDRGLILTECNTAFGTVIGTPRERLMGLDMKTLKDQRIRPALEGIFSGESTLYEGPYATTTSHRDLVVRLRCAPVFDGAGRLTGGLGITEDITGEQRRFEERTRAQKLESLGLLAGGIAHDFNNILTAILGNLSLARSCATPPGPEAEELIVESEKAAYRARDLTQQLLTFAKGGEPVKKVQDAAPVIREAASFALRGSRSRFEMEVAPGTRPVDIDAGQIGQVIQNLVINADQAMPEGGLIRIRIGNLDIDETTAPSMPPGPRVHIEVEDEGAGIPPGQLSRIFDPYFTTKQKGSGLGLATCYAILHKHDGAIRAESELGRGSVFHLYLPAAPGTAHAAPETPALILRPDIDPRRILVMDDEGPIRSLARRILSRHGFRVDLAADGAEAVAAYARARDENDPFHLVILDLTVPGGMGGEEALARIRAMDPEVRAIVSSGYSNNEVMARFREHGFAAVFPKPYRSEDLLQMVLSHARDG